MSTTQTTLRGAALNTALLARGFLPLLNARTGALLLYRCGQRPKISDLELANVWLEQVAIREYLKGVV